MIIKLETITAEDYFGGCPVCGEACLINVETEDCPSESWFVCQTHFVKWFVGSGLFSNLNSPEEEGQNWILLDRCREVVPVAEGEVIRRYGRN